LHTIFNCCILWCNETSFHLPTKKYENLTILIAIVTKHSSKKLQFGGSTSTCIWQFHWKQMDTSVCTQQPNTGNYMYPVLVPDHLVSPSSGLFDWFSWNSQWDMTSMIIINLLPSPAWRPTVERSPSVRSFPKQDCCNECGSHLYNTCCIDRRRATRQLNMQVGGLLHPFGPSIPLITFHITGGWGTPGNQKK